MVSLPFIPSARSRMLISPKLSRPRSRRRVEAAAVVDDRHADVVVCVDLDPDDLRLAVADRVRSRLPHYPLERLS